MYQNLDQNVVYVWGYCLTIHRVTNKEGQKVSGYKTMKKCAFEATNRLIASKNIGHFVMFVI